MPWNIDYTKVLRAVVPSSTAAPFSVTTANRKALGDVTITPSEFKYFNRVLMLVERARRNLSAIIINYTAQLPVLITADDSGRASGTGHHREDLHVRDLRRGRVAGAG